ncbi:MAG: ComF family protein [Methylomonas sp.]
MLKSFATGVSDALRAAVSKLLPPRCIFCGRDGFNDMDLCIACFSELPRNAHCCYRCGESFDFSNNEPQLCGHCLSSAPDFDATFAPFLYQGNIRYLVTQLKFSRQYANARLLGGLLARHVAETAQLPDLIVPMPLHVNRYRERQFNQSIEIAAHVAQQLAVPLDLHNCIRIRDTVHQTGLSARRRRKNMRRAFAVKKPIAARHIAVLDDVMTTGATASELAKALKQHGAQRVDVWVCARA